MPLALKTETLETRATAQLKAAKKLRSRYSSADASQAIEAAASAAASFATDAFVVASNRYGQFFWKVTMKKSDATCIVSNSGRLAYRVTPDREIFRMQFAA